MKTKLTLAVLLPLLVFGPALADSDKTTETKQETASTKTETSVSNRRSSLPAGWFEKGKTPLVLTDAKAKTIAPVAHFDVPSDAPSARRSAAQRLQNAKNAKIYSLPNPIRKPKVELQVPADAQTTVDVSTEPAAIVKPEAATNEVAESNEFSLEMIPGSPSDQPIDNLTGLQSVVVEQGTTVDAGTRPGLVKSQIVAPAKTVAPQIDPADTSLFSAPPVTELSQRDDDIHASESRVSSSVVTRSSIRHNATADTEANLERMQLSPIGADLEESAAPQLTATPMTHGFSAAAEVDGIDADVLISNQNPVINVQTRGPRTIVVGKPATYTLVVLNDSQNNAKDVSVNVRIPTWTEVQSQDASVGAARLTPDEQGDTVMRWSVGQLAAHGKETLKLQIVPRSSRPFDLGVTWDFNPARTRAQIQVQEPKLDLSVVGPADVHYGQKKVYTLTVSNPGTGDAENVILQLLPFVPNEDPAVRELGTLKAGERRTLEVELKARQTGRLQIRAEATAANGLRTTDQQEVFVRRASIQVKAEAPEMKYAGSQAIFRIRVTNTGDAMARDVIAVAALPKGATEVRTKANGVIKTSRSEVHWELGALRPGAVRVLEFACTLTEAGANRVDVRSVAVDNLSAVTSATTTVESLADLKLTVNDPKEAIATGTEMVYEVRVQNRGTKEAKNISLVGYFSEGIEPTNIDGWTGKVKEGQVEMDHINRLGPGQELTIKLTAVAHRPGNHVFRAELTCNNPETRLASEDWTRFYGDVRVLNATSKPRSTRR